MTVQRRPEADPANRRSEGPLKVTTKRRNGDPDRPARLSTESDAGDELLAPDTLPEDVTESTETLRRSEADEDVPSRK